MYQEGKYYLIDVKRARLEYHDLKREVEALAARYKPDANLFENTSLGAGAGHAISAVSSHPNHSDQGQGSRLAVQAAKFEAGQVFLPTGKLVDRLRKGVLLLSAGQI